MSRDEFVAAIRARGFTEIGPDMWENRTAKKWISLLVKNGVAGMGFIGQMGLVSTYASALAWIDETL